MRKASNERILLRTAGRRAAVSPAAWMVVAVVLGTGAVLAVLVLAVGRSVTRRLVHIMVKTGIAPFPEPSGTRSLAHESVLAGSDPRSVRDSEALAPAERGNGRDIEVERSLAALAGLRAAREPDS